jgi:hypothetical protein
VKFNRIESLDLDDAVALMEMQLTYLRIVEVVSGRELALEVQKGIFRLYSRIFGPVSTGTSVKREPELDTADHSLRRTRSNITSETKQQDPHVAIGHGKESLESKSSLRVPAQMGRPRSILRRHRRSRSVGGRSIESRSSAEFSSTSANLSMAL